jgi:hypothetical protein
MSFSYYASRLSNNIGETPEGFLICRDCVIARTGWQKYEASELPADSLKDLGIDGKAAGMIDVYRSPEEVFNPATLASFEGKSLCDDHPPGAQFVDPSNIGQYEFGHVQNVRRGSEPLESGEEALLGDIIIKREPLLSEVRNNRKKELSCGYDYELCREGDSLVQRSIIGNHVAVVPKGRAGAEARIIDSAPESQERKVAGDQGSTGNTRKEKPKVANLFKHLLGLGLKAYAVDAEPEKLAEAAEAVKEKGEAKDEFPEKPEPKPEPKPEVKPEPKAEAKPEVAEDLRAKDHRKRMHDALDCMLNEREKRAAEDTKGADADLEELADLLDEFFEEEAEEPEHQDGESEAEPMAEDAIADDVEGFVGPDGGFHPIRGSEGYKGSRAGDPKKKRRKKRAKDSFIEPVEDAEDSASDSAFEVLKALRPSVARSKDAALRSTFNALLSRHTRSSRPSNGGYGAFASAARRRAADAGPDPSENPQAARDARIQAAYNARRTGQPIQEVKK